LNSLNDFIHILEAENQLIRVQSPISPNLQITEIADRIMKSPDGGKAILFENTGTAFKVLINAFGSEKRMGMALGYENADQAAFALASVLQILTREKESFWNKLKMVPVLTKIASAIPTLIKKRGKCQEVIQTNPDLDILPILKCWPFDGGKFITLPIVITKHPETGVRNSGMYRMQVLSKNTTGMHWHLHKGGAAHYEVYKKMKMRMPVAVALGGDPVYTYAAVAPAPDDIDEFMLAGLLRKRKVKFVSCITQNIEVPADSDIVIEGYIDTEEDFCNEGPFGDHTGMYSLPDAYPVFHVTAITHRKDAIYPATIVGVPPMEDRYFALATEKLFFPALNFLYKEIVGFHLPWFGVAHNLVLVKIRKRYPGHAFKIMHGLLGNGQMMFSKTIICVDEDLDFNKPETWLNRILQNIQPAKDVETGSGPTDVLDHAAYRFAYSGKLLIDASNLVESDMENPVHTKNPDLPNYSVVSLGTCLLAFPQANTKPDLADFAERLSHQTASGEYKVVVITEKAIIDLSPELKAWYILNNFDPGHDSLVVNNCLFVNATIKTTAKDGFSRNWPNIVSMDDKTIADIDALWPLIFPDSPMISPSLQYKKLIVNKGASITSK